ncbi:MAG TPA: DUF2127 domain-containing protein [Candidatus Acidoferrum sp.]|nr:DUF2127 domain-containing protein [Candidatus Acidoferrum sp.]
MKRLDKAELRELLFRISIVLKGLNAILEIAGGIALMFISPRLIARWVDPLTRGEFAEESRDFLSNYLRHAATHISLGGQHFIVAYLLGHGVVKFFLVVALLRNKLWGYPAAMVVFGGFIVYQIYLLALYGGLGLIALTIFDVIVILLIWLEYRAVKSHGK